MSSFWSTFRCVRRFEAIEAVAQADDGALPRKRNLLYVVLELFRFALAIDALQNIVFRRHDVHQHEGVAVLVRVDRLVDGDILRAFLGEPEIHQDLVFNAPRGITRKADPLRAVERVDRLDETDRPDGDQVVLLAEIGVILFERTKQKEIFYPRTTPSEVRSARYSSGRRSRKMPQPARCASSESKSNSAVNTVSSVREASASLFPCASAMKEEP